MMGDQEIKKLEEEQAAIKDTYEKVHAEYLGSVDEVIGLKEKLVEKREIYRLGKMSN